MNQKYIEYAIYIAIAITFALVIYGFYNTQQLVNEVDKKMEEYKASQILPYLRMVIIDPECLECRDYNPLVNSLEQSLNVNLSKQKMSLKEASSLIEKYSITKVPAVILEGNISVLNGTQLEQLFRRDKGALIFESLPPYYEVNSNKVRGVVEVKLIEHKGCDECFNMRNVLSSLENAGVVFEDLQVLEHPGEEANKIVEKYKFKLFPFLLVSKEIDLYGYRNNFINSPLIVEVGDYYILKPFPPYFDLENKTLRGRVEAIYLNSENCEDCVSIDLFKGGISRMGLYIANESILSIESKEGQELVESYNIEYVPTVILRGDLEVYQGLIDAWKSYGKYENNALIYTDYSSIQGNYFDVKKNITVISGQEGG